MTNQRADYDNPWKEALSLYFQPFMAFFFPEIDANINWSRGYEFLDKEFQQVVRDAEIRQTSVNQTQQFQIVTQVMANVSAISKETSHETAQISDSFKELEETSNDLQTNIRQFKVD